MFGGAGERVEINVTEIRLPLARINYAGHPNEYIVIPVWDFYGEIELFLPEDTDFLLDMEKEVTKFEEGMYIYTVNTEYQSIGTVNALNKSIINRNLGY